GHGDLGAVSAHSGTERRGQTAFGGQQPALFETLFDQLAHACHLFGRRRRVALNVLVDTEKFHFDFLLRSLCLLSSPPSSRRRPAGRPEALPALSSGFYHDIERPAAESTRNAFFLLLCGNLVPQPRFLFL